MSGLQIPIFFVDGLQIHPNGNICSPHRGGVRGGLHLFFPRKVTSGMSISSMLIPPCWKVSL